MINTWFISDTHFGHKNILEYEKEARPFSCLEEMHEVMIERWNSVVKPKDILYHLGDFAFGRHALSIASRLNGQKRLVMGNHDTLATAEYLNYFDKLYGVIHLHQCILSHIPVNPMNLGSRWFLNVHGHLHSKRVKRPIGMMMDVPTDTGQIVTISTPICEHEDPNYFNVSCEQNNLTPIHYDVIKDRINLIKE